MFTQIVSPALHAAMLDVPVKLCSEPQAMRCHRSDGLPGSAECATLWAGPPGMGTLLGHAMMGRLRGSGM